MRPRGSLILVTTSFPIRGDGSEAAGAFVSDFAEELSRIVPVRVVAPGRERRVERWGEGIEVHRYAAPDKPLSTLKPWWPSDLCEIRDVMANGEQALAEAAAAVRYTGHILALWALPSGHWARRVAAATGMPYSAWTLGSDIWSLGRIPLVRGHLGRILRDATHCYADGLALAEDTRRISGRDVEFLPSTRRLEALDRCAVSDGPPYRLLFLGRWHRNKGIDLLLEALLSMEDADWSSVHSIEICGGGPLEPVVARAIGRLLELGRPVALRGYLDKREATMAILRADYVLVPSRIESIPVVFSDAMKLGRPVVTMPVGDLPALVRATLPCGIVASNVSPNAFLVAILEALSQPPAHFREGVAHAAHMFDIRAIAVRTVERLLGEGAGRTGSAALESAAP